MSTTDWLVLIASLAFIVIYGIRKSRGSKNIEGFLLADKSMPWYMVGLSIMATQASAVTFISLPGQGYGDGMRFVQFYFGLPIAMVILCITAVPVYKKLSVFTSYEYLENRFDLKTRVLASSLFLLQRGLATGLTIYAPGIVLATILGWNLYYTTCIMGFLVISYTVWGGTVAVSHTQKHQVVVIFGSLFVAFAMLVFLLPTHVSFGDAVNLAGKMGKLNAIDFSFDLQNRYNFWSGLIGGLFLSLSYFGTDQSQVARYLSGSSVSESRLGLLFNGIIKIPMQFFILFIGILLFVFYLYHRPPVFFNAVELANARQGAYSAELKTLETTHNNLYAEKVTLADQMLVAARTGNDEQMQQSREALQQLEARTKKIKEEVVRVIKQTNPLAENNDTNYVFLSFVLSYLPHGVVGLLIAMIFAASMSATSSAINALASSSVVDVYKRIWKKEGSAAHYLGASRVATVFWGIVCILFAMYATDLGNLIEAMNILGSLFYGTILGMFLVAFYLKWVKGGSVFYAAIIAEVVVVVCAAYTPISFLWYNVIGCGLVVGIALILNSRRQAL